MASDPLLKQGVNRCVEPHACCLFPAPTRVHVRRRFREPWPHLASRCNDFGTTRHGRLAIAHRATCRHHKTNAVKIRMQGLDQFEHKHRRVREESDR